MKFSFAQEIIFWVLLSSQYIFLIFFSEKIPDEFPTHWDLHGNPDSYSSKYTFPILSTVLYVLMFFIPKLDPRKENLEVFADSYYKLRVLLTLLFTMIFFGICLNLLGYNFSLAKFILISVLMLFMVIGNYMKNFRPNYFIGIRTPWTLENEIVWKKTHELGGKLFFYNSLFGIILCIFLEMTVLPYFVFALILVACVVPVVYSFLLFRRLGKESG